MYYYRELGSGDVGFKMGACDNLQKLYASLGQRDSSDKYNQLHQKFRKEMDSKYDLSTLLEKQIEFDAHNHFMELLRYVLYGVGAIVMVVGLFWKRKKVAAGFVALFSSLKKRRAQKKSRLWKPVLPTACLLQKQKVLMWNREKESRSVRWRLNLQPVVQAGRC